MTIKKLTIANTISFVVMVLVNILADILKLGGYTTAEISQKYANLFTPAPITFAVWGVIYLLLIGFLLYSWRVFDKKGNQEEVTQNISWWFVLSCLFNTMWIVFWHFDKIGISLIFMLALLYSLYKINRRTNMYEATPSELWFVKGSFGIYWGWITVATIANIIVFGVSKGVQIAQTPWQTTFIMLVGAMICGYVLLKTKNLFYGLAVIWGYMGILIRQIQLALYPQLIGVAILCEIFLAVLCLIIVCVNLDSKKEIAS